ncbi:MAG: M12 family metallo-peptidase [Phycisphaerales bacterium]|nr:M12 family metallo-peptidase [Phycisphaerales bacterium]
MSRRQYALIGLLTLCVSTGIIIAVAEEVAGQSKTATIRTRPEQPVISQNPISESFKTLTKDRLNLADVGIQQLNISAENGAPFETQVHIEGRQYTLDMWPYSLRADDFQLLVADDNGIHEVFPPEPRTYRGVIRTPDGSAVVGGVVSASMSDGKLTGMINLNDGNAWFVESLAEAGLATDIKSHAIYKSEDSIPTGKGCGVNPNLGELFTYKTIDEGANAAAARGTGFEVADIAFEADFPAFQDNGSSVSNTMFAIETVMNTVETIYETDTDITYEMTTIVVRTTSGSDPYTTSVCNSLLNQFQNEWNSNFTGVRRDMAHLLSGRNLVGCAGIAAVGVVCSTSSAYGLSENLNNFNLRASVIGHELGHNWNACHCDESPPFTNCPNSPCRIMCSGAPGCPFAALDFGPGSITTIVSFRNTRPCLFPSSGTLDSPVAVPLVDTFTSTVFNNTNWIYVDGAVINTGGVNEPSGAFSLNLDSAGSGEFDQNEVRSNFILLAGQPPIDVDYQTEHRGVEFGEELIVEYWSSNLTWVNLNTITSTGTDQNNYVPHSHTITSGTHPDAFHDEFRLRFRVVGDSSNDDWYIDNVSVALSGADLNPPTPDPAEFAVLPPTTISDTQIEFQAVTAVDPSGVEYFFDKQFGPGCCGVDSGWVPTDTHIAGDLLANSSYSYKVKARDTSPNLNETAISALFATGSTFIETPFNIALVDAQETEITVTVTCNDTGDSNRCVLGAFTNLFANPPSGLFLDMLPLDGSGSNVWTDQQTITVTGLTPGTDYTFKAKARNRLSVETAFSNDFIFSTLGGGCPTVAGDINQDGDVDGDDIAGYIRAKLGLAPEPGEEQSCADFGNGADINAENAAFVAALLS